MIGETTAFPTYSVPKLEETQTDEVIVQTVLSCTKAGEAYRQKHATYWDEFKRKFNGDYYQKGAPKPYESRPNKYKEFVDLQVNLLTQQPSKDYCVRVDETGDDVMCDIHTKKVADDKRKCFYQAKEDAMLQMAGIFGPGLMKVFYNKMALDGLGNGDCEEIDPKHFFVNPGCKRLDDATFCGYKRPVSLSFVKKSYPALADKIKGDKGLFYGDMYGHDIATRNGGNSVSDSATGAVAYYDSVKKSNLNEGMEDVSGEQVYLIEMWYRDPRAIMLNSPEELRAWIDARPGFGGENSRFYDIHFQRYMTKARFPMAVPLYPHGRILFVCGGQKLEDYPNPYSRKPFVSFLNNMKADVFWPFSTTELISEPMKNYHMIRTSMAANAVFRNTPPWVTNDRNADITKFKALQGNDLYVLNGANATIKPMEVPQVAAPDNMRLLDLSQEEAEGVTGLKTVLAGGKPSGTYTARLYEGVFDTALKGIKKLVDRMTTFREEVGDRFREINQYYINDDRLFEYANEDDKIEMMRVNQMQPAPQGANPPVNVQNDLGAGVFSYRMEEGTGMPVNKISLFNQGLELGKILMQAGQPMRGIEMILSASGWPGWKGLLRAIKQEHEQVQQAQQQQMQQVQQEEEKNRQLEMKKTGVESMAKIEVATISANKDKAKALMESSDPEVVIEALMAAAQKLAGEGIGVDEIQGMIQDSLGGG